MLTKEEIDGFDIDIYKLKLTKIRVVVYKEEALIFAIQITRSFFKENVKLITPLPNKQNLQINQEDELIVIINKEHYV